MMQQSSDLWAKILDSKYGGWRSLVDGRSSSNGSLWWKDLMEVTHEHQLNNIIQQQTVWKVGCGDKARFWEDNWAGDGEMLMTKYPRLYQISSQQHQTVQQMGRHTDTAWEWNFRWRRPLFDCEIEAATRFLEDTTQIHIHPHLTDCWKWRADPNGQYTTRSAYLLMQGEATEEINDGVFTELWKLQIPPKAAIFAWRLIKDRLPTKLNLRRRQIQLSDYLCPFCMNMEEDASHLFFNCPKIQPLWWESLSWINTVGAMPANPRQHFIRHPNGLLGKKQFSRWKVWWVALNLTIWQHRNQLIFSNEPFNGSKLMEEAVFLVWSWFRQLEKGFTEHYNCWSSNLSAAFCN